jgi:rubrerythrin
MNVFEFAMQMEMDGKAYYEENAARIDDPGLKKILMELAEDEQKHYNLFMALRDGADARYEDAGETTILTSVKNVFQTMKDENQSFAFADEAKRIWAEAQEVEKKSEAFYREKAREIGDDNQKSILNKIADEEHKHWVTLESVIQFLKRPERWLEDAEWNNLEDY